MVTHRVSKSRGTVFVRCDRCRPHRCAVPSARCDSDCAWFEPGLVIWLQRVGRQRLADHRLDGLLGVTNFDISMAASLLGRRGARRAAFGRMCSCSWLCAVGQRSAVLRRARLCCGGARMLRVMGCSCSRHGLLSHDCARDADCLQGCRELCRTHAEHVGDAGSWLPVC